MYKLCATRTHSCIGRGLLGTCHRLGVSTLPLEVSISNTLAEQKHKHSHSLACEKQLPLINVIGSIAQLAGPPMLLFLSRGPLDIAEDPDLCSHLASAKRPSANANRSHLRSHDNDLTKHPVFFPSGMRCAYSRAKAEV